MRSPSLDCCNGHTNQHRGGILSPTVESVKTEKLPLLPHVKPRAYRDLRSIDSLSFWLPLGVEQFLKHVKTN